MQRLQRANVYSSVAITADRSRQSVVVGRLKRRVPMIARPRHHSAFPTVTLTDSCLTCGQGYSASRVVVIVPYSPCARANCFRAVHEVTSTIGGGMTRLMLVKVGPACPSTGCKCMIPIGSMRGGKVFRMSHFARGPSVVATRGLVSRNTF